MRPFIVALALVSMGSALYACGTGGSNAVSCSQLAFPQPALLYPAPGATMIPLDSEWLVVAMQQGTPGNFELNSAEGAAPLGGLVPPPNPIPSPNVAPPPNEATFGIAFERVLLPDTTYTVSFVQQKCPSGTSTFRLGQFITAPGSPVPTPTPTPSPPGLRHAP